MTASGWQLAAGVLVVALQSPSPGSAATAPECFALRDVAATVGVTFRHVAGRSPAHHLPETMGAGVAWLDYDGDGWLDLYLVQSGAFPPNGEAADDRLFRNRGDGTFEDATARAGAGEPGYGQGVVAADVEGDGDVDLYVANVGRDTLLRNRGDGTFADETAAAGLGAAGWSSSAAFADADGDRDLDLYVARYVRYDPQHGFFCGDFEAGRRDYCDPTLFPAEADLFYRNRGDGTFAEETVAAGLAAPPARGLGVVFADLDGDRQPEIYVANDLDANLLFHNLGGRFEEVGLISGAAVNRDGKAEAGMGIAAGDVDGDAAPELLVTNFDVETNTLYRNLGGLQFQDVSAPSGFGPPSYTLLGFGIVLADLDRDGDLDAFVANGHVFEHPRLDNVSYAQPPLLLAGDGRGRFTPCAPPPGPPHVSRGLAAADFDNDGDADLAISDNDGPAQLLRNDATTGSWLGVRLAGRPRNTEAVGALVVLESPGGTQRRWVLAGDSYQSASDRRVMLGWPTTAAPTALTLTWPDGRRQRLLDPPAGRFLVFPEEP